ncbi:MAG: hypothetical protein AVDCRST_MAG93-5024 [uncultured Chloroflexia bacterium]|uniref:Uncharacterized protein n=1 Tax=uncultured Chloroflexia bacterium TaxID=1672391 RepID=A0A6J4KKR7_9CHLR|nr:MAG: hypothetical protein AVDCRST_MAG93-5024 [uncultured Chloroflexia bacterium]
MRPVAAITTATLQLERIQRVAEGGRFCALVCPHLVGVLGAIGFPRLDNRFGMATILVPRTLTLFLCVPGISFACRFPLAFAVLFSPRLAGKPFCLPHMWKLPTGPPVFPLCFIHHASGISNPCPASKDDIASGAWSTRNQRRTDAMICVGLNAALFAAAFLQRPFRSLRSCRLEAHTTTGVPCAPMFTLLPAVDGIVAVGRQVDDAKVHTKRTIDLVRWWLVNGARHQQKESARAIHQVAFALSHVQKLALALTGNERHALTTAEGPDRERLLVFPVNGSALWQFGTRIPNGFEGPSNVVCLITMRSITQWSTMEYE